MSTQTAPVARGHRRRAPRRDAADCRVQHLLRKPAPTFSVCYALGVALNQHIDTECTLEELGLVLGVSKQNAYTASVLALGKLAWLLARRVGPAP